MAMERSLSAFSSTDMHEPMAAASRGECVGCGVAGAVVAEDQSRGTCADGVGPQISWAHCARGSWRKEENQMMNVMWDMHKLCSSFALILPS